MKNKLYYFGCIFILSTILGFASCQQPTSSTSEFKYYVEGGVVSKSQLQAIVAPYENKTNLTFDDIKAVRNKIRACPMEDFASEKDVVKKDCQDFLTQHGFTPSEADEVIQSVNDTGNVILFFNVKNSTVKAAYIYAEKQ